MLRCVATFVNAYTEGLGPGNTLSSEIRRAPGKAATPSFDGNPEAGMGGSIWLGFSGIAYVVSANFK